MVDPYPDDPGAPEEVETIEIPPPPMEGVPLPQETTFAANGSAPAYQQPVPQPQLLGYDANQQPVYGYPAPRAPSPWKPVIGFLLGVAATFGLQAASRASAEKKKA